MVDELLRLLEQLDQDAQLFMPDQLRRRLDVLDLLDARIPESGPASVDPGGANLRRRGNALRARLESANREVYQDIRAEIQRGHRPESLLRWAGSAARRDNVGPIGETGYGFLDELVSGVLQFEEPQGEPIPAEPEMVAYQPSPAQRIFDLIDCVKPTSDDLFIDLGSGMGHVPLMVSICTGARTIGIELEGRYVESARQCGKALNLHTVTFLQQDAREADLSAGTIFYLYTPFTGSILRTVLDRLRDEARRRRFRICTYGPCTLIVADESWLAAKSPPVSHRVVIFEPRCTT